MKGKTRPHERVPSPAGVNQKQALVIIEALSRMRWQLEYAETPVFETMALMGGPENADAFLEGIIEHFIHEPDERFEELVLSILSANATPLK